mmetsp:Transcript_52429/g.170211  ORF Transcript_52429/g.170211 Transcript_52429/m.170211 type:complete len:232 (+) Transcript_52429:115-810(+)
MRCVFDDFTNCSGSLLRAQHGDTSTCCCTYLHVGEGNFYHQTQLGHSHCSNVLILRQRQVGGDKVESTAAHSNQEHHEAEAPQHLRATAFDVGPRGLHRAVVCGVRRCAVRRQRPQRSAFCCLGAGRRRRWRRCRRGLLLYRKASRVSLDSMSSATTDRARQLPELVPKMSSVVRLRQVVLGRSALILGGTPRRRLWGDLFPRNGACRCSRGDELSELGANPILKLLLLLL